MIAQAQQSCRSLPAFLSVCGGTDHPLSSIAAPIRRAACPPPPVFRIRTGILDPDRLYGGGPAASRHLYQPCQTLLDPAGGSDTPQARMRRVLALSHNGIVRKLLEGATCDVHGRATAGSAAAASGATVFQVARQLFRWHLHWAVLHDFLPRWCGQAMTQDILRHGPRFFDAIHPVHGAARPLRSLPEPHQLLAHCLLQHSHRPLNASASRIVAEAVIGSVAGDPMSFLSLCPDWTPTLAPKFGLREMVALSGLEL